MRLTTKGRFAVTAMLDLALSETNDGNLKPVTPVSYTHLDVYKRQMKYCCKLIVS